MVTIASLLTACSDNPCTETVDIPQAIASLGVLPDDTSACNFGSATPDERWQHIAYAKLYYDDAPHVVATNFLQQFEKQAWQEVLCDGALAGSEESISVCFVNANYLVRSETYELGGSLVDFDLYATGP